MDWFLLAYASLGLVAGLLAGLLGIGGGLVIVPALIWLFTLQGFDHAVLAHMAIGSSLATIIPTALSSMWAHHKKQAVDWAVSRSMAPGLLVGAFAGAMLADQLSTGWLTAVFGCFLLVVGLQMAWGRLPEVGREHQLSNELARFAGGAIGLVSGVVGIGGGTMTVPFLVWRGKQLPQSVATSAACGLPIALGGMAGFMFFGLRLELEHATGYVYWPAVVVIGLISVVAAPRGAELAHAMPVQTLKKLFALLLFLVGAKLILS